MTILESFRRSTAYRKKQMKATNVHLCWREITRGLRCSWLTWLNR